MTEAMTPDAPVAHLAHGGPEDAHRFVTSDGTALHVRESGPAGAQVTVLLVHGWAVDHRSWDRVACELGPGIRVLRYDHRCHGGSECGPREATTIEQLADDLAELIESRVPHGPLVLAGHSMGGMAVMALAERHEELVRHRVSAVAFVATSSGGLPKTPFGLPRPVVRSAAAVVRAVNARRATHSDARPVLPADRAPANALVSMMLWPALRLMLYGSGARWSDVRQTAVQVGRAHRASMAGFRRSISAHQRAVALRAFRDMPAVVFAGGADRLCPPVHARRIARSLPGAEYVVFPAAGHMLPHERAAEVAGRIARLTTTR